MVIRASGWGLIFFSFHTRVWGSWRREKAVRINGGCSLVWAGILISLDLPRQGDRGNRRWQLWEHEEHEKRTGNKRERIAEK